ncbi:unnamed protein product [Heligmosomoides polygyrus]|uniref:Apple domain-containing protein n=1 Tax=Heligmosomoides polygyrus TaxID=6339 RepID=A0A183FZN7_HELPZ|nr:unnamed protein product [Heligmosomoides polygyrus]
MSGDRGGVDRAELADSLTAVCLDCLTRDGKWLLLLTCTRHYLNEEDEKCLYRQHMTSSSTARWLGRQLQGNVWADQRKFGGFEFTGSLASG